MFLFKYPQIYNILELVKLSDKVGNIIYEQSNGLIVLNMIF
jgi:hypothetical protein